MSADDDWDVEDALEEVVKAIKEGSRLTIGPVMCQGYKDYYKDNFARQKEKGAKWPKDRVRILAVAHEVGALARWLTICKALVNSDEVPEVVDKDCAYSAAYIVAHSGICTTGEQYNPRGAYCRPEHLGEASIDLSLMEKMVEATKALIKAWRKPPNAD